MSLTVATPVLGNGRNHGVRPKHGVTIATLALIAACSGTTEPQRATSCTLDIALPSLVVSAHYPVCPAPPGALTFTADGYVYTVRWDAPPAR